MDYKISVIIPTYNSEKYIEKAINSVFNQSIGFENIELIIVDDNSTDSTREIIKKYEKYPNIKCIFQDENSGTPSRGRNIGIDNANSEYVMFLDNDDIYTDSMCEVLYNTITETNVDIAMCNYSSAKLNDKEVPLNIIHENDSIVTYLNPEENIDIYKRLLMWDKIFKLDFLNRFNIRCPDGYFREDHYFCIQAFLNTKKVASLEDYYGYIYNERFNEGDLSSSKDISTKFLLNNITAEFFNIEFLKKSNNQKIINHLWGTGICFTTFFYWFVLVDANYATKKEILNDLYDLIVFSEFNGKVYNKLWAFFYRNIKNRRFLLIMITAKILNILYKTPIKTIFQILHSQ